MAGEGAFSKWKSKQLAGFYAQLVFQVTVFDFIFSQRNTVHRIK